MKAKMIMPVKQGKNTGIFTIEGDLKMDLLETENGFGWFDYLGQACLIDCMPDSKDISRLEAFMKGFDTRKTHVL